jgi:hypothetical protein
MWNHSPVTDDEWGALRDALAEAGVSGASELGRFVSNTEFFPASGFDERAAMPVLLAALPTLSDRAVVIAVAGHLRPPWARPTAFGPLHDAFLRWAPTDEHAGWALGDALGTAATAAYLNQLLLIGQDYRYGKARQMVVHSLGRYRKHAEEVVPVLLVLVDDSEVGLHAMGALRRILGPAAALPHVEAVVRRHDGTPLGDTAVREARKIRKVVSP